MTSLLRRRFWPLLGLCFLLAALILILMPAEKTLGQIIKIVYLHGALSRAGMIGFWAAGIVGIIYLLRPRPALARWTQALLLGGWSYWAAHFLVSMPATRLTWGPWIAWGEPRVTMTLQVLLAGLVVDRNHLAAERCSLHGRSCCAAGGCRLRVGGRRRCAAPSPRSHRHIPIPLVAAGLSVPADPGDRQHAADRLAARDAGDSRETEYKMKVVNVEEMRRIEQATDAGGQSYATMMEMAGQAVVEIANILQLIEPGARALILVGPGNNGGDGLVAARYLCESDHEVTLYIWKRDTKQDDNFRRLKQRRRGLTILRADNDPGYVKLREEIGQSALIVDALLGTGTTRPIEGELAALLAAVKQEIDARRAAETESEAELPLGIPRFPILDAISLGSPRRPTPHPCRRTKMSSSTRISKRKRRTTIPPSTRWMRRTSGIRTGLKRHRCGRRGRSCRCWPWTVPVG